MYDVIILGTGPAGLTASIYTQRAGLKTLCITKDIDTSQLIYTNKVENFPSISSISGYTLIEKMKKQALKLGVEIIEEDIVKVDFKKLNKYKIITKKNTYTGITIIICLGSSHKKLEIKSEYKYIDRGISYCFVCDGSLYRNKTVAVIGGGDSALEATIYLSKIVKKLYLLVRSSIRGQAILQKRINSAKNVEIRLNTTVDEFLGNGNRLNGVIVRSGDETNNETETLDIDGCFVMIGQYPNTELFKNILHMDNEGYLLRHNGMETDKEGIFSAGDISDTVYKQAITSAGDGCKSALECIKYFNENFY